MMLSDSGYVLWMLSIMNFLYVVEILNIYSVSLCTNQYFFY
jgi:hypothetical protein